MKILTSIILTSFFISLNTYAWGPNGHRITGHIAQEHLSSKAKRAVKELIGPQSLAQVSVWADFIKSNPAEWRHTFPWHYINVPQGKELEPPKDGNHILGAIDEMSKTLKNKKAKKEDRIVALKFLVHLVGDVHQPMHVGRAKDRGGNRFKLKWFGEPSNLHEVWDEKLVEYQQLSYTEFAAFINHPTREQIKQWQNSAPLDWAKESREIRKTIYASTKENENLKYEYNYKFSDTINQRLLQGGVRLAGLLNELLK